MIQECDISDQIGPGRKIKIEIRYVTDEEAGQIKISKLDTDEVICTKVFYLRLEDGEIQIK